MLIHIRHEDGSEEFVVPAKDIPDDWICDGIPLNRIPLFQAQGFRIVFPPPEEVSPMTESREMPNVAALVQQVTCDEVSVPDGAEGWASRVPTKSGSAPFQGTLRFFPSGIAPDKETA